jgi:hypothetical protein
MPRNRAQARLSSPPEAAISQGTSTCGAEGEDALGADLHAAPRDKEALAAPAAEFALALQRTAPDVKTIIVRKGPE